MTRTQVRRLTLSAIALFSLFSCNGAQEKNPKDDDSATLLPSEAETSPESDHEPITLMNAQRDYKNLIALVKEKYPEINIQIEPYRGWNMSAYCKQQIETGSMPDIYSTTQAWDEALQKTNLLDLSGDKVASLYNAARIGDYTIDGKLYLLPFDYTIQGIAYNKTLFEKNGISVPQSFTELKETTIPALQEKNIDLSVCLLNLPGSSFNYFFNVGATSFMGTKSGKAWRNEFTDLSSSTFSSGNENVEKVAAEFQEWIDCGMIHFEEGVSDSQSKLEERFHQGNTAFMMGNIKNFSQNEDGTGDQYALMPYLSKNGDQNCYITSPGRFYGLSKKLGEKGNEQKLQDAMHVLEVLSTNEGYLAINGEKSNNLCSIKDFQGTQGTQYYADAIKAVSKGHSMDLVYTGWDDYLAPFGNELLAWVKKEEGKNGTASLSYLDSLKTKLKDEGRTYYAEVTEELSTIQAAQLSGQIFMEATEADAALISYNIYNPEISANYENSYGANGRILKGKMSEEYITIWLPTGWNNKIDTVTKTGKEIKAMAQQGADTRATGFHYPYVFLSKDGKELSDEKEYKVALAGYNKSEKGTLGLVSSGILGLDAAKTYLKEKWEISSATLNDSLLLSTGHLG